MLESPKAVIEKKIYKPNDQFIKSIRGLYLTLNFFGIWPRNVSTNWYKLIWFFHSACFVFHVFGPMAGLIVQRRDTEKVIENLGLLIPATCIFIEWFTFATRRIPVKKLLCSMEEDWVKLEKGTLMSQSVPDSNRIMASYSRSAKIFFYTYVGMLMLGVVNYVIDCTSARKSHDNDTDIDFDKVLPVPHSWYPLDYSRESNIQFLVVAQTITSTTFSMFNASIDSVFVTVTLHLCGQLKILRYFIESITYDSARPEICKEKVTVMIKRHQVLLREAEIIQESFSFIILEKLLACTYTICFLGYIMIMEIEMNGVRSIVLLKTTSICAALTLAIFAYCFVGDSLTKQNTDIAMAVYNSQWFNCPRSISLSCLLVMLRSGKTVEITGAKLLSMSLATFTELLRAAISYLSVLRAMNVGQGDPKI